MKNGRIIVVLFIKITILANLIKKNHIYHIFTDYFKYINHVYNKKYYVWEMFAAKCIYLLMFLLIKIYEIIFYLFLNEEYETKITAVFNR